MQQSWGVGVVLYVGDTFLTTFAPIPRLGIMQAVLPSLHLPGSGLWIEQPWRVLAMGAIYFGGQAAYEIAMAIRNWRRATGT